MYDELVKRLRGVRRYTAGALTDMLAEAADAIEVMCEMVATAHGELANVIQNYEESKPRWIPVTEQLPIRGDRVICFGDNGINTVDFVCGDKWCALPWFYLDGEQETGVTHWMPLPEPPKEE